MDMVATVMVALVVVILTILARSLVNYAVIKYKLRKIDGPRGLPLFGNIFQVGSDGVGYVKAVMRWSEQFRDQGYFLLDRGMAPSIVVINADDMEKILRNTKLDAKGLIYRFFKPWLADGLITSAGAKWAHRRKLLTPSFHFTILNKFLDVFNGQAQRFTEKICGMADGRSINIHPLCSLCTLDVICETIMGHRLDSQDGKSKDYVDAVRSTIAINVRRSTTPWLRNDYIFSLLSVGKEAARCLKIMHGLTKKVIRERKQETADRVGDDVVIDDQTQEVRKRRKLALLDLLIEVQKQDGSLTDEGIQEEVDTFMFAGHDTTAAAIALSLYLIGRHPLVQDRIHKELDEVFGTENEGPITQGDLAKLEYFNCVIKECHRLLPPVPFIGRTVEHEFDACGITIPVGTVLFLNFHGLHRDPKYFPDPEKFDPDRFAAGNSQGRHPFAYSPFSAGHRNCIGQKFAVLEQKVVVASVLRKMKVTSLEKIEDLKFVVETVLRPVNGINLKFEMRD